VLNLLGELDDSLGAPRCVALRAECLDVLRSLKRLTVVPPPGEPEIASIRERMDGISRGLGMLFSSDSPPAGPDEVANRSALAD
jgi:hypothetical protein